VTRKSIIQREMKKIKTVEKYAVKRKEILDQLRKLRIDPEANIDQILELEKQMHKLPRNSSPVRVRNRCIITGKPRGYYRKFGLSRNMLRKLAMNGQIPGVVKSSW
jgi:small subunit ribosomal protein S14